VKAQHDKPKVSKASSCNNIFPRKVLSGCTENLWPMLCTILEVPLGCFNHDRVPSCSSFWHKCKESNGLILPRLRFASKSLLNFFYQGQFPCWACCRASIAINLLAYMYRVSWLNASTRVFLIQLPHAIHLTYHHVFYVKPSMSQTPKLRFHVFENISSVMNIWPRVTTV